ncbi:MAG: Nif3-like dinuclear metal center hexameric protein [Treponema sp.]|uniref:Nif3-like dinuclear metal center hexameric protein n=1 Tax=Treponema sp. TaxID=166 RepID=UPI002A91FC4A|nr:Nif3-like dinuclear metal center hexameric protein [Treponema sp.]MDY6396687.1 Nif3-like dinuclear metal center hexameric protein [Treponema sp.]
MNLNELNRYFNSFLHKEDYDSDVSLNGIQISNSAPNEKPITKVAFAVDACEATALKAAEAGAQVLFVHHGLFWGHCETITGTHYKRVAAFIKNDLALIAYHIPLDANEFVGNNFGIAKRIGLEKVRPFGKWRGMTLGAIGELSQEVKIDELAQKLFPNGEKPSKILPFGKEMIKKVAVISGGAGEDFTQAVKIGADAYITGEVSHEDYHGIEESGINVIAGGHYNTETVGVQLVQKRLEEDKGLQTVFIDIPTGL